MFLERSVVSKLIFFACFAVFIGLGCYKLTYFGLEYDEALFINAALGDLDGVTFVYYKLFGIPILTYSYIGALKSWIYALIFNVFGVSLLSIRLPIMLLAVVNFFLVYRLIKQSVSHSFALLFLIILSVDLTFLTLQRFDKGPSAIEMCIKLSILLIATNQQLIWRRKAFWVLLLMVLGVFNKLNFIWFANAVFGVFFLQNCEVIFLFFRKKTTLKGLLKSKLVLATVVYIGFLVVFFMALKFINVKPNGVSFDLVIRRSTEFLIDLKYTLMQRNVFHVFGWTYQHILWNYLGNAVLVGVLVQNVWLYLTRKVAFRSIHTRVLLLLFLLAIQYIITPDAQKIWHMFVLFPMATFVILHTFWLVAETLQKRAIVLIPIVVLFFLGNVSATTLFYTKINQKACVTEIFIPEVKEVERYLSMIEPSNVITTDWGIHTQMQAFFHDKHRFFEPFRMFRFPSLFTQWWEENQEMLEKGKEFVILQPVGTDIQQPPFYQYNVTFAEKWTDDFVLFLKSNGFEVTVEEVVRNSCGERLFIIYKAKFLQSAI